MSAVTAKVSVQPGMKFGAPCIDGHRLPTDLIAYLYEIEGESAVMDDYDLTHDEVMVACWFEARHGRSRKRRKAWRAWLDMHEDVLWESKDWSVVPFPPRLAEALR